MLLYHATDEAGKTAIEAQGFGLSHSNSYPQHSFFQPSQDRQVTSWRRDWWVIVDVPAEVVEEHRITYGDGTKDPYNIPIPWEIVNRYKPFRYERWIN